MTVLIAKYINLLSFNLLNELKLYLKLVKNHIIFVLLNTFIFNTNYIIRKKYDWIYVYIINIILELLLRILDVLYRIIYFKIIYYKNFLFYFW